MSIFLLLLLGFFIWFSIFFGFTLGNGFVNRQRFCGLFSFRFDVQKECTRASANGKGFGISSALSKSLPPFCRLSSFRIKRKFTAVLEMAAVVAH